MPIGNNGCDIWKGCQRSVAREHSLSSWPPLQMIEWDDKDEVDNGERTQYNNRLKYNRISTIMLGN